MQALQSLEQLLRGLNDDRSELNVPVSLGDEEDAKQLASEVQAFLNRVASVLTTLDGAVTQMGVKEALNVLQLRRLTELMDAQSGDVQRLGQGVEELAQGVTRVAEDTHQAAEAAATMKETGSQSLSVMEGVLKAVTGLEDGARAAQTSVGQLVEQTAAAAEGLKAIRGVAATSQMLALNAAIQAAHANDRAFAVVANEMRRLADRTDDLGKQIETQVSAMEAAIASASGAMKSMAEMAGQTSLQARDASGGLQQVDVLLTQVSEAVQSIAAVAEQQAAATEEMAATAQDLNGRVQAAAESMNLTRNMAISEVTEEAQAALGQFYIGSQADQVRALMDEAAGEVEKTVERLVADHQLRLDDLWDYEYREIKGADISSLAHLFRVDRVPPEGFNPPKYRTAYDQKIDLPLMELMDRYIAKGHLQFCCILDLNVFTVVHGRSMSTDWTGDYERDLRDNRVKRLFTTDANARKAARISLPSSLLKKERIGRQDIASIPGPSNIRPFLLQTYALDSGDVFLAMAVPLFVGGKRWATLRAAYLPQMAR